MTNDTGEHTEEDMAGFTHQELELIWGLESSAELRDAFFEVLRETLEVHARAEASGYEDEEEDEYPPWIRDDEARGGTGRAG